jgi:hypothetical protein
MTFPTASASVLGNGKWEAGPAFVVLTMSGHWVIGVLANNQWSLAGWGKNNLNSLLVQPFINHNSPHGWYLTQHRSLQQTGWLPAMILGRCRLAAALANLASWVSCSYRPFVTW